MVIVQCRDFLERLDAYIDGELNPTETAAFKAHLDICSDCKKIYDDAVAILAAASELANVQAPEGFAGGIMEKIKHEPKMKQKWPLAAKVTTGIAAGLLLCVVAVSALQGGLSPRQLLSADQNYAGYEKGEASTTQSTPSYPSAGSAQAPAKGIDYSAAAAPQDANGLTIADRTIIAPEPIPSPDDGATSAEFGLKIIRNGSMSTTSAQFENDTNAILNAIAAVGGYLQSSSTSGQPIKDANTVYGRNSYYTARIPSDRYAELVEKLKLVGTLENYSDYSEDITSQYYDTQARLDSYKLQYQTIEALLTKAVALEDILRIQTELTNLQYQIDSLTGTINRWDFLVSYSTLSISVQEIADAKVVKNVDPTLGERIREAFVASVNGLIDSFESLIVWLSRSILPILMVAAIALVACFIVKGTINRKKKQAKVKKD